MKKFVLFIAIISQFLSGAAQDQSIDSLKVQLLQAKEDTNKVILLDNLSFAYTWSYPDTSVQYARQALALSRQLNYDFGIAISYHGLCRTFTTLGNFPLALDYGFKALSLYQRLKKPSYIIGLYADIGICYREQGDYINGIKYGRKSLELAQADHADILQLTGMQGMLSSIYEKNHQPDSAIKYAEAAYSVQKQWSGLFPVLGSAYAQKGNYAKALEYYQKGILIAEEQHLLVDLVDIYNSLSEIYKSQGRIDSAIYYATKAVQQEWGRVYPASLIHATATLANLYEAEHKSDSALKYYQLTLALKDSFFSQEKARVVQNIAFNEQQRQQQIALTQQQYRNKLRTYGLIGGLIAALIIAGLLWRNIQHKQRAYALLQQQKAETDKQRDKAEQTLQELKATQVQLVQREKMASLGELTAGIAHEIQNPLNFVNNFSEISTELLEEQLQQIKEDHKQEAMAIADTIKENLQKVIYHGSRADAIVKGMLQHSRQSTGKKEPTDINTLTDEYLWLSYNGMRAKDKSFTATIETHFDDSMVKINVIPQDIGRVLLNLFNNAFYAVNEKKQQLNGTFEPIVSISTKKVNDKIEITVKDNGTGIPEKIKDKVFQPFFTTKPTGQGTGLGLSLSYDIVKAHGGELTVSSEEGSYSEFTILLPIT